MQLRVKTVVFQTIQISMSTQFKYQKQFYFTQFSLGYKQFCFITVKF